MMHTLKVKKICQCATLPTQATPYSAGYDLYANVTQQVAIDSTQIVKIPTGIAIELPENTVGLIFGRSGLGINHGIVPANAVGVIDCDYRGEIVVGLTNHSQTSYIISPNDKIAQLVIIPVINLVIEEVSMLSTTLRAEKGLGSTGK